MNEIKVVRGSEAEKRYYKKIYLSLVTSDDGT